MHPACMGGGTRARIAGERLEARPSVTSCAGRGVVWCGVVCVCVWFEGTPGLHGGRDACAHRW